MKSGTSTRNEFLHRCFLADLLEWSLPFGQGILHVDDVVKVKHQELIPGEKLIVGNFY